MIVPLPSFPCVCFRAFRKIHSATHSPFVDGVFFWSLSTHSDIFLTAHMSLRDNRSTKFTPNSAVFVNFSALIDDLPRNLPPPLRNHLTDISSKKTLNKCLQQCHTKTMALEDEARISSLFPSSGPSSRPSSSSTVSTGASSFSTRSDMTTSVSCWLW